MALPDTNTPHTPPFPALQWLRQYRRDFSASVVVFLVALPLCLGIALASGAPLESGIIAGVVGGVVVGAFSGSPLSVSGPAAGLIVVVAEGIKTLGSFEAFLVAVVLSGLLQIVFSYFKAGGLGEFIPSSVIRGMLAAIGIVIILKQIPHALGRDIDFVGNERVREFLGANSSLSDIIAAFGSWSPLATAISLVSIVILITWEPLAKRVSRRLAHIPAALVVVLGGVAINTIAGSIEPTMMLTGEAGHVVSLPVTTSLQDALRFISVPDFSALLRPELYVLALTLALVASIETLLSVEATDKLDPLRRISNTNRELFAQGVGNAVSGLMGGLPITAVIVRSSANVYAGALNRASTIAHGALLALFVLFVPGLLNLIPLASLASILLVVGYKLCSPKIFMQMKAKGIDQFVPFLVTVCAIVATDLLFGVGVGLAVGILFVIRANHHRAFTIVSEQNHYLMRFNKDLTFIHRAQLKDELLKIPNDSVLSIDGIKSSFIDTDIMDVLVDFRDSAHLRNIKVEFRHLDIPKAGGMTGGH